MINVQEALLREKIDPWLTETNLSALATAALGVKTRCHDPVVLTGGCWNRVIAASIDDGSHSLVFKVTPKRADADLQREFDVLRYFRAHTALPVPEVYLVDTTGDRVPGSVLVMAKAPGVALEQLNDRLSDGERAEVAAQMAGHIADLHKQQAAGFGGLELTALERAATWPEFWLPRLDQTLAETREKRRDLHDLLAGIDAIRDALPALLDIGARGTLTHYDIWGGNVMVHFVDNRPYVSAYLDAFGYYADYAREISSMFGLGGQRFMDVYTQRHGLDDTFDVRHAIYSLKMSLQMACMYKDTSRPVDLATGFLQKVQHFLARRGAASASTTSRTSCDTSDLPQSQ